MAGKFYATGLRSYTMRDGKVSEGVCLKIVNSKGVELSLALDNSIGALDTMSRVETMLYPAAKANSVQDWTDAENILQKMAGHLGYKLQKL